MFIISAHCTGFKNAAVVWLQCISFQKQWYLLLLKTYTQREIVLTPATSIPLKNYQALKLLLFRKKIAQWFIKSPAHNILVTASTGKFNILSFHHFFLLWYQLLLLSAFTETQWSLQSLCDGCDWADAYALLSALRYLTHLPAAGIDTRISENAMESSYAPLQRTQVFSSPSPSPQFLKVFSKVQNHMDWSPILFSH